MKRIIIIEDDEGGLLDRLAPTYRRLDFAKQQAWDRARAAADYFARCSCNPDNGGSGICGCVHPFSNITCSVGV